MMHMCSAINDLCCYITMQSLFTRCGARVREHGVGKPDHHHLGGSLFPHIPPLQGLLPHIHTVRLLQYSLGQ